MPRVIMALLRHGAYDQPPDVPSAHLPYPLNEAGREQARNAVSLVLDTAAGEHWEIDTTLDSSRLLRAAETATLMAHGFAARQDRPFRVVEYDELAERSVGSAANLTTDRIDAILRIDPRCAPLPSNWQRDGFYRLPLQGAESLIQAGERVARHLEARASQMAGRQANDVVKVVVGHGGSFRYAAVRLGILRADDAARLSMHHCAPIYLERRDAFTWVQVAGAWKERMPATARSD